MTKCKEQEMSWMSKKTGRPKEQGGHHTFHVSFGNRISKILEIPKNRSKYIEDCVIAFTGRKWIAFHESDVTVNDDCSVFKPATTDFWVPSNNLRNGIVSTVCIFECRCTGRALLFRMRINESLTSSIIVPGTIPWSSGVFTDSSFDDGIRVQPNRDCYVIEIQFQPFGMLDLAYVRDVSMFLEVVDGLPTT